MILLVLALLLIIKNKFLKKIIFSLFIAAIFTFTIFLYFDINFFIDLRCSPPKKININLILLTESNLPHVCGQILDSNPNFVFDDSITMGEAIKIVKYSNQEVLDIDANTPSIYDTIKSLLDGVSPDSVYMDPNFSKVSANPSLNSSK